jgi:hypothetical protein
MSPQNFPTTLDATCKTTARELDSRITDGIHVRLLWHPHDGRVSVTVNDAKTGEAFALDVGCGQRPLDVFHHPFAYATNNAATCAENHELAATRKL